ncbi:hypothetical protein B0H16DRAFT_1797871 [Mycena metata]|uniref:Uncharacterized protein n=1 Tax=Mycena metata TaxID=1033252 RepID=A0AAD7HE09_9AGAR|nr:hypothetical protein B0H16DRAFT_1797871 [Mycena metata]
MHLVENIVPALVKHWTGTFKDLDQGSEGYQFPPSVADAIGAACAKSGSTIPSAFGARVPDIMKDRYQCTAESWFLFTTLLGPVVLHNRFSKQCYYDHFVQFAVLIIKCLRFEISAAEIDEIETGFADWVQTYERFYYQYEEPRLSACTLPIHALLHIASDIRNMGPMWCFWAFVMERFCGSLVPAVKSRKHPFASLAHRLRDVAQLNQIKLLYGLTDELNLSADKEVGDTGHAFADYDQLRLVYPNRLIDVDEPLRRKIAAYLTTNYVISRSAALTHVPKTLSLWGKLKQLGGGDLIHAWDLVSGYHTSPESFRDATFIKYTLEVDKNQNRRNMPVDLEQQVFFGQARKFIALAVPADFPARRDADETEQVESARPRTIILAAVSQVKLTRRNKVGMPYFDSKSSDLGPVTEVIDVSTIDCLAGRIQAGKRWACLVRPEVTAKFRLVENSTVGDAIDT